MIKLRDQYDWVVLGDHPGALLSASLAARLGLSVLILPVFPGHSLVLAEDGRFVDPEPNHVLSLGRVARFSGLLSECLSRLGILPIELEKIQGDSAMPEILTPGLRVELAMDDDRLEHVLRRELGGAAAGESGWLAALKRSESEYLSYWLQLPERLTLAADKKKLEAKPVSLLDIRRKIGREGIGEAYRHWLDGTEPASALSTRLGMPGVLELLEGSWFGICGSPLDNPRLDELLHLMVLARTGASYRGGMVAYREFLVRLAKRLGAHAPSKIECKRIFVDRGRFTGVQVSSRANVVAAGGAIAGCGLSQLSQLVAMEGRVWRKRLKPSPTPIGWRFTVNFVVNREALPPNSGRRLIWKEAEAPPIEIEIADAEVAGTASGRRAQQRAVLARTILPFTPESLAPEYQRRVAARMLRQLTEVFPYLESHLAAVFPEFRGAPGPESLRELGEVYGFKSLDDIPENLRCLSPVKGSGVGSNTGIEGLFVATGESFPEALGTFGSTVAAMESVSWLAHRAGLAGPFA